jgi:hypothetical protein
MKGKFFKRLLVLTLVVAVAGCGKIPTEFTLNTEIDTGRDLQNLIDGALEDLQEAEHIAGEEARLTIQEAMFQLQVYSAELAEIFGGQLDQLIGSLDAVLQDKLLWMQIYTEEVHGYALSIIHATGEEARATINEATLGMRRAITETELAAQRTTVIATQNMVFLVDTVAERTIAIIGVITGLVFMFISAFGWGRLIYQRQIPSGGLQQFLALGLMMASFFFSFLPFTALIPSVRAFALAQVGRASTVGYAEGESFRGPQIPTGSPRVYDYIPDHLVVPIAEPTPHTVTMIGANLMAMGEPSVTYGGIALEVVRTTEDEISVAVGPVSDNPGLASSIKISFGEGDGTVQYSYPVYVATPAPTPEPTTESLVIIPQVKPGDVISGTHITIPEEVVGLPVNEAMDLLSSHGFGVGQILHESNEEVPKDLVARTDPPAGTSLVRTSNEAQQLMLFVSRGALCETENLTVSPIVRSETFHPRKTKGDREFGGHVSINVSVSLYVENNAVMATIYMSAEERVNDDSTAEGFSNPVTLYTPEPGWVIRRILSNTESVLPEYRDTDHGVDEFIRPSNDPVEMYSVIGDTSGNDIGQEEGDTGVTVDFRDISVEVIQAENCAGVQVEVVIDQVDFHTLDDRTCALKYEFAAANQKLLWQPSSFTAPGSNNIGKKIVLVLLENENLYLSAQGLYAINCDAPLNLGGNLGKLQREYSAASAWGAGIYAERITNPWDVTLHYHINADWLP